MLDVHGRDDGRRSERSDRNDSRPLRTVGYRPRRLWNQVFRDRSPLAVGLFEQNLVAVQRAGGQLSFLCACGKKSIELKTLGCCRVCYDRQYHSLRFFGGIRERVLERDRYRCRACGTRSRLVVYHRDGRNEPDLLITLCIRCHTRIHRSSGFRHWLSGTLLRLWRELHRRDPVQLQLVLKNGARTAPVVDSVEPARMAIRSLFPPQGRTVTEGATRCPEER
jgi:hypothetical protein